jgi:hypothetical protein
MGDDSMREQPVFFDIDDRWKRLSDLGGQLEAFRVAVDFETSGRNSTRRFLIRTDRRVAVRRSIR